MTLTIDQLAEKWDGMSNRSGAYLLISGDHPLSFHIGYHEYGQKSFVVINTGEFGHIESSKGISVSYISTGENEISIRFDLNFTSLDELFVKLCWDLIDCSKDVEEPSIKLLLQYKKWAHLFQKASNPALSLSKQKGLLGELLFFKCCLSNYKLDEVLNAWVGPDGNDQDFTFPDLWAEVKATSIAADDVKISSLQQLDRNDEGMLAVFFMDRTDSNGINTISLPETIKEIRNLFSNVSDLDRFTVKLTKVGYFDRDQEIYEQNRFYASENRIYKVSEDFPRLTNKEVPTAVTQASYYLSLPAIDVFKI